MRVGEIVEVPGTAVIAAAVRGVPGADVEYDDVTRLRRHAVAGDGRGRNLCNRCGKGLRVCLIRVSCMEYGYFSCSSAYPLIGKVFSCSSIYIVTTSSWYNYNIGFSFSASQFNKFVEDCGVT